MTEDIEINKNVLSLGDSPFGASLLVVTASHLSPLHPRSDQHKNQHKRIKPNLAHPKEEILSSSNEEEINSFIECTLHEKPLGKSYQSCYQNIRCLASRGRTEQTMLLDKLYNSVESYFKEVELLKWVEVLQNDEPIEIVQNLVLLFSNWDRKLKTLFKVFSFVASFISQKKGSNIKVFGFELILKNFYDCNEGSEEERAREEKIIRATYDILRLYRQYACMRGDSPIGDLVEKYLMFVKQLGTNGKLVSKLIHKFREEDYQRILSTWEGNYIKHCLIIFSRETDLLHKSGLDLNGITKDIYQLKFNLIFEDFSVSLDKGLPELIDNGSYEEVTHLSKMCEEADERSSLNTQKTFAFSWSKIIGVRLQSMIDEYKGYGVTQANPLALINNLTKYMEDQQESLKQFLPVKQSPSYTLQKVVEKRDYYEEFIFEFRTVVNKFFIDKNNNTFIMQQLCKFCDLHLRSSNLSKSSEFIKSFATIFKSLGNKTDFLTLYKRDLSKRLLLNRYRDLELEKAMINECARHVGDDDSIVELKGMFDDLESSTANYSHVESIDDQLGIEFNALVLNKKNWPDVPKNDFELNIPNKLHNVLNEFDSYFKNQGEKAKGKILDWTSYNLHQLVLRASFNRGDKDLVINLLQAVVLLLFETDDRIEFNKIASTTNIEERFLKNVLSSFCTEKYKILIHDPTTNTYTYNRFFTDKSDRIKLPLSRDKNAAKKNFNESIMSLDAEKLSKNRESEFRCTIIKVMKAEEKIMYSDLLAKTISIVEKRSPVTIQDIKKHIEVLINQEYIERQPDGQTLVYIP